MRRTRHHRSQRKRKLRLRARMYRHLTNQWQSRHLSPSQRPWRKFQMKPIVLGGIWPANPQWTNRCTLPGHHHCRLLLQQYQRSLLFHAMRLAPRKAWILTAPNLPAWSSLLPLAQLETRPFPSYPIHLDLPINNHSQHPMPFNPSPLHPQPYLTPGLILLHSMTHQLPVLICLPRLLPRLQLHQLQGLHLSLPLWLLRRSPRVSLLTQ